MEWLLSRHEPNLVSRVRMALSSGLRACTDAADLIQTTYLEVLRDLHQFTGTTEAQFEAWLRNILDHNIHDCRRYCRPRQRHSFPLGDSLDLEVGPEDAGWREPNLRAEEAEIVSQVRHAMAQLPRPYQEILSLCGDEGCSPKEASFRLKKSRGAVRAILMRARIALASELRRLGARPFDGLGIRHRGRRITSRTEASRRSNPEVD